MCAFRSQRVKTNAKQPPRYKAAVPLLLPSFIATNTETSRICQGVSDLENPGIRVLLPEMTVHANQFRRNYTRDIRATTVTTPPFVAVTSRAHVREHLGTGRSVRVVNRDCHRLRRSDSGGSEGARVPSSENNHTLSPAGLPAKLLPADRSRPSDGPGTETRWRSH